MVVPMVEAITALRSWALCSAAGSGAYVVAIAMAYLPVCSPSPGRTLFQAASCDDDTSGRGWLAIDGSPQIIVPAGRSLLFRHAATAAGRNEAEIIRRLCRTTPSR